MQGCIKELRYLITCVDKHIAANVLQVGFFELVALPLLTQMTAVLPGAQAMLDKANKNYLMWRAQM